MKSFFVFLLLISFRFAFAQQTVAVRIYDDAMNYRLTHPQEKLYVHTDKTSYTAGDILWFKVYDMDAATHMPLDISKVSYVEIITRSGKSVLQAKIKMQRGSGSGSFLLPFSLNSDNYVLKAYTTWMKNFGSDTYFEMPVAIINTLKKTEAARQPDSSAYSVQLFPEGGNLASGLTSNIAFKGVDEQGNALDFTGHILNAKNDTLATFRSDRFGVGAFSFTPNSSETYRAVIRTNGRNISQPFPHVYEEGYVMTLKPAANNKLLVSVVSNIKSDNPFVHLLVQPARSENPVQSATLVNGKASFIIDKNSLAEGVSRFTLFDDMRQPLCERVYCRQPKPMLALTVTPDAASYAERKKVSLQISLQDDTTTMNGADLSVSVYRVDSMQMMKQPDIYSSAWFSPEIKGIIASPDKYLSDSSSEGLKALDNLMLTQGWRRFAWENNSPSPSAGNLYADTRFLPEYEGQTIAAIITERATGLPAKGVTAYLSIPGSPFQFSNAVSDDSGRLLFSVNLFYGSGQAVIQTKDTTGNLYIIAPVGPFVQTPSYTNPARLMLPETWRQQLLQNSIAVQTQNAYLSDERQRFDIPDEGDTTVFYGKPDKQYKLDDYTRFPTMEEVMREYVTEVRINKNSEGYQYTVDNLPYHEFFREKPLVLLDGIPVWNTNRIVAYNPLQVRQLDVVTHKYYFGGQTYSGIVSYLTYKSDGGGLDPNQAALQFDYEGLQLEREFYTPVYETPQQTESRVPDFRTTLFWSPDINMNGSSTVSFYTSDLPGDYEVVVQGNTNSGLLGSKRVRISVVE